MRDVSIATSLAGAAALALGALTGCGAEAEPAWRFEGPDDAYETVAANAAALGELREHFEVITDIDHARLATEAGSPMPPAHVLIVSDPSLDAAILALDVRIGVDLPLRVLAYADPREVAEPDWHAVATDLDLIADRHEITIDDDLRARWRDTVSTLLGSVAPEHVTSLPAPPPDADPGIVTLDSPHDFAETRRRLLDVITEQSDTIVFAEMDLAERSRGHGVDLPPTTLILFGAPAPGGLCMADAPILGLDGFCQKLLVWQDGDGAVHATFNDLVALAERQHATVSLPLRHVNRRIRSTLEGALSPLSKD